MERGVKLIPFAIILFSLSLFGQGNKPSITESEFREELLHLMRMSTNKPFLRDSSDVLLERQSLNRFFTDRIYERLTGNAYFGYRWDEGFTCPVREISIVEIKDLTGTTAAAYRLALEQALFEYQIKPDAVCQIGLAIVGIEAKETERTLPGVMVEAYLRNSETRRSFFIRFGAGSPRGLSAAIRISTEMLVAELEGRHGSER